MAGRGQGCAIFIVLHERRRRSFVVERGGDAGVPRAHGQGSHRAHHYEVRHSGLAVFPLSDEGFKTSCGETAAEVEVKVEIVVDS